MGQIANSLGITHPTRLNICKYMYTQPLQHTPGAQYAYSNFGYLMLAALVDKYGGTGDYLTYLKKTLFDPAGITEVEVISTAAAGHHGDEAIAEDAGIGQNALNPAVSDLVPSVYGGDGEINEVGVGNDGLGASAHSLAEFAHRHAAWGNGPRANSAREGSTPGGVDVRVDPRRVRHRGHGQHARLAARDEPGQVARREDGVPGRAVPDAGRRGDLLTGPLKAGGGPVTEAASHR
jgi:CubicO group peptidase (beta-lactamase class C family)